MYPLPLLVRVLHTKWQPFLLNRTWKTQHRKVKVFFLKCVFLGESNRVARTRNGPRTSVGWIFSLFIPSLILRWWQGWVAWGWGWECFYKAIGRNYAITSYHCLSNQKCHWEVCEAMATTTSKTSRHWPPLRYLNMALDTGYVSEARRRQAKR